MTHLSKCFQAIDRLILDESGARPKGCGIVSCVGIETCNWTSPLLLDGKVEQYMNGIIDKMRSELKSVLLNSVKAYPAKKRTEWLFDWPSQVCTPNSWRFFIYTCGNVVILRLQVTCASVNPELECRLSWLSIRSTGAKRLRRRLPR